LASGDFNGDGKDDLAVGVPGKKVKGQVGSGNVLIYKGGSNLAPWKNLGGQAGLGKDEKGDQFGYCLISGDFNGDGKDDLAVGLPGEKPGSFHIKTGYVFVYSGSTGSIVLKSKQGINP
jgi:hypothetical protein